MKLELASPEILTAERIKAERLFAFREKLLSLLRGGSVERLAICLSG